MEYRAIRAFGWTHEQYMDTPAEARNWLLHIDKLAREHEAEQREQSSRG